MRALHLWIPVAVLLGLALFNTSVQAEQPPTRAEISGSAPFSLSHLGYTCYSWPLPDDAQSLYVNITDSSGNMDLILKHGSAPAGNSVTEIMNDADFVSNGPSWEESISVDALTSPALQTGTYYACVINRNQDQTSGYVNFSAETPDPASPGKLYFPHVDTRSPWITELGAYNQGSTTLAGTLTLYNDTGVAQGTTPVSIAPGGMLKVDVGSSLGQETHGYAVMDYAGGMAGGYTAFAQPGTFKVAVPAVLEQDIAETELYLTHVDSTDEKWWTGFALVNTTATAKTVTLSLDDGSQVDIDLPANGHMAAGIRDLFGETKPNANTARLSPAQGVIGLELFATGTELTGFLVSETASRTLNFSKMESGALWTGLAMFNPGVANANLTITSYSEDGSNLGQSTQSLTPGQKLVDMPANLGVPTNADWVQVTSDQPIMGFFLIGAISDLHLGGASSVLSSATSGVFPALDLTNENLELYLANTDDSQAYVYLKALSAGGAILGQANLSLPAHGSLTTTPAQLFNPLPADTRSISFFSFNDIAAYQRAEAVDGNHAHILPASRTSAVRAAVSIPGYEGAALSVEIEDAQLEMGFWGDMGQDYDGFNVRSDGESHDVEMGEGPVGIRAESDNGIGVEYDSEDGQFTGARILDHGLSAHRSAAARTSPLQMREMLRRVALEWWNAEMGSPDQAFEDFFSQTLETNDVLLRVAEILHNDLAAREYLTQLLETSDDTDTEALSAALRAVETHVRFLTLALKQAIAKEYGIYSSTGEDGYAGFLISGDEAFTAGIVDLASGNAWNVLDTTAPTADRSIVGISDDGLLVEFWADTQGQRILVTPRWGRGEQREVFPADYLLSATYGGEMQKAAVAVDKQGRIYFYAYIRFSPGDELRGIWRINPDGTGLTQLVDELPYRAALAPVGALDVTGDGTRIAFSLEDGRLMTAALDGTLPVTSVNYVFEDVYFYGNVWINDAGSTVHFFTQDYKDADDLRMFWLPYNGSTLHEFYSLAGEAALPGRVCVDQAATPRVAALVDDGLQPGDLRLDIIDGTDQVLASLPSDSYPDVYPVGNWPPAYVPEVDGYVFSGLAQGDTGEPDLFLWTPFTREQVTRVTQSPALYEQYPATRR